MLHHALNLDTVLLPGDSPVWSAPLTLTVELDEVVLIEGVDPEEIDPLLMVVSTLEPPRAGMVRHWGKNAARLGREDLLDLRRRIACISPDQVLLHRLTLAENISLSPCYHQDITEAEALASHTALLAQLEITPYLDSYPPEVPPAIYTRALWARDLLQGPELIMAVITPDFATPEIGALLNRIIRDYRARYGAAVLLLGWSLAAFYSLGHRLFWLEEGELRPRPLLQHQARPLASYLPLF
jgi:ABC-type transporter Mla maintaining outer membrane lipid asymmetry ATPase subunit MlaF